MGKTREIIEAQIAEADEYLPQAGGRIKTLVELADHVGETLYFVIVEAGMDRATKTYVPSHKTRMFRRRLDYFLKRNSGGGFKRFIPRQEVLGGEAVYIFEHGNEGGDYTMWEGVNVALYNVPKSPLLYAWNAVFTSLEDAERYRLWIRMAHEGEGWQPYMNSERRYMGKIDVDRRQIMVKKR